MTHEFADSGYRNLGPDQKITRREAIAMGTRDAAKVLRWEGIGSLEPGAHADLAAGSAQGRVRPYADGLNQVRAAKSAIRMPSCPTPGTTTRRQLHGRPNLAAAACP